MFPTESDFKFVITILPHNGCLLIRREFAFRFFGMGRDLIMHRRQFNLAIGLICLSVGCTSLTPKQATGKSSLWHGEPQQIRESLLSQIPLGTPRADAIRIATSMGLEPTPGQLFEVSESNSLHFQKEGKQWWGGQKVSMIQIECSNGVVEDIFCEQIGISR